METSIATDVDRRELVVGTRVEVHTRYEIGRWVPGFTIAGIRDDGYKVRRTSDGSVLTETLNPDEVRLASPGPRRLQVAPLSQSAPPEPQHQAALSARAGTDR
jgi:hypothetical protein